MKNDHRQGFPFTDRNDEHLVVFERAGLRDGSCAELLHDERQRLRVCDYQNGKALTCLKLLDQFRCVRARNDLRFNVEL